MFIKNAAIKTVSIGKALGPSTLSDADHPVLLRMKNSSLWEGSNKFKRISFTFIKTDHAIRSINCDQDPLTCLPIGSGFVMVVLKYPSHSSRPYSPAQLLCRFPVCGRHHGTRVLNCRSAGSHGLPSAHEQTPRKLPSDDRPFFLS